MIIFCIISTFSCRFILLKNFRLPISGGFQQAEEIPNRDAAKHDCAMADEENEREIAMTPLAPNQPRRGSIAKRAPHSSVLNSEDQMKQEELFEGWMLFCGTIFFLSSKKTSFLLQIQH